MFPPVGGEVYAWGTNSMGQCGQGHSNGSIVTPAKVQGLDGVQVQQISAGTSHSIVWTAVPLNRFVTAWIWVDLTGMALGLVVELVYVHVHVYMYMYTIYEVFLTFFM